jgi:hypothetical protein
VRRVARLAEEPVGIVDAGHALGGIAALLTGTELDAIGMVEARQLPVSEFDLVAGAGGVDSQDAACRFDGQRLVAVEREFATAPARGRGRFLVPWRAEIFCACEEIGIFAGREGRNAESAKEIGKGSFAFPAAPPVKEILCGGSDAQGPAFDEEIGVGLEVFAQSLLDLVDQGWAGPEVRPLGAARLGY